MKSRILQLELLSEIAYQGIPMNKNPVTVLYSGSFLSDIRTSKMLHFVKILLLCSSSIQETF